MRWHEKTTKRKISKKIKKAGRQIRKHKPKMSKYSKNTPKTPLAVHRNSKSAIKFEKKAICKREICEKQAQKTSKLQLKQPQKQATRKSSKKPATPQKNKPKFAGKPQGWQH